MTARDRRGYTLAEAMSALVVAGLLTLGLAAVLAVVARAATRHAQVAIAAETERTAPAILGTELRSLTAADATFDGDSVRLRAFRGGGVVCARVGAEVVVAYKGVRAPEPEKDSVLLLWPDAESAHRVAAVRGGACGTADAVRLALSGLDEDSARPIVGLVFETGAYSLAASAFRYRRGAAGRQPLTDETLTHRSSLRGRSLDAGAARADVVLHSKDFATSPALEWLVALPQGGVSPLPRP